MATGNINRDLCDVCGKTKAVSKCHGCEKNFCFNHFDVHRQQLGKKLDEIEVICDTFRQRSVEQTEVPQYDDIIERINKWEKDAIDKIRQTAEETRQSVIKYSTTNKNEIDSRFYQLASQLKQSREDKDFVEIDIQQWKKELNQLWKEISKPSNISLEEDSTALVNKISIKIPSVPLPSINIDRNAKWAQHGTVVVGGNGRGNALNQLNSPWGFCIDSLEEVIYIADTANHRIIEWKHGSKNGQVVVGGNSSGNQLNQLNAPQNVIFNRKTDSLIISDSGNRRVVQWPRRNGIVGQSIIDNIRCVGLAVDHHGSIYVCDCDKHEVKRLKTGENIWTVVAGGNGRGNNLNQLDTPMHIFVDNECSLYVSDQNNHRVMKWMKEAKEGVVVAGGQGSGNSPTQVSSPRGIIVDQSGNVYMTSYPSSRIIRWCKEDAEGSIIIGENVQLCGLSVPQTISFDSEGNLYVADLGNDRIQKFDIV